MSCHFVFLRKLSIVVSLSAFFAALPMAGQTTYGSILGTVSDQSGSAIVGATVVLSNTGTSERRNVLSGSDGGYQLVNLLPGNYRIEVEQPGFKRYVRDQINVQVDAIVRIEATLQVGDATQTV